MKENLSFGREYIELVQDQLAQLSLKSRVVSTTCYFKKNSFVRLKAKQRTQNQLTTNSGVRSSSCSSLLISRHKDYNKKRGIEHGLHGCARIKRIRENPSDPCHPCSMSRLWFFFIKNDPEDGFNTRVLDYSIFTQDETNEQVIKNIIDAANCHFDNANDIMVEEMLHERR